MITVNDLKELLESNEAVSAYEIRRTVSGSCQLFYVMRELETNRTVQTEEISLTVYSDFDEYRGSSAVVVTSADDRESVAGKLAAAVVKARQAKNPYYPLAEKTADLCRVSGGKTDLAVLAKTTADAVFSAEGLENSRLNATEVFADYDVIRFLNSSGIDHTWDRYSVFCETIPSYNGEKEDVELYFSRTSGIPEPGEYTKAVRAALENVRYRSEAVRPETVPIPADCLIAVQSDMLRNIMVNFARELSYSRQFHHMSHYDLGSVISRVPFDLVLKGEEAGISTSAPIDGSGIILKETKVISRGKAAAFWGDQRFGYYLKAAEITGSYPVAVMENYPVIGEADQKRPVLYLTNFSAPQLDSASGYFGGEVRLGLLVEGEKVTPLTGFSVSGNIYEAVHSARFSKETENICARSGMSFKGPKYMYFDRLKLH